MLPASVFLAVTLIAAASPAAPADPVLALNQRIETAVAAELMWPRTPAGLAGNLFGFEAMVARDDQGDTRILFRARDREGGWGSAVIARADDHAWRVRSIGACPEELLAEALERRSGYRHLTLESRGLDYVTQGPLDLLELLKRSPRPLWHAPVLPQGWIRESDLPDLIALLDSSERCANVTQMTSSVLINEWSTVGNEAAFLIEGYRQGVYPPGLVSVRPGPDIEAIKAWWEGR